MILPKLVFPVSQQQFLSYWWAVQFNFQAVRRQKTQISVFKSRYEEQSRTHQHLAPSTSNPALRNLSCEETCRAGSLQASLQHSKPKRTPVWPCQRAFVQTQMQCVVHGHNLLVSMLLHNLWNSQESTEYSLGAYAQTPDEQRVPACIRGDAISTPINQRKPRNWSTTSHCHIW